MGAEAAEVITRLRGAEEGVILEVKEEAAVAGNETVEVAVIAKRKKWMRRWNGRAKPVAPATRKRK